MSKQNKIAYRILSVEDFGKLMSFCIDKDVCVFRTYFNNACLSDRCYTIDWKEKRCYYGSEQYYLDHSYTVITPTFLTDVYGNYYINIIVRYHQRDK